MNHRAAWSLIGAGALVAVAVALAGAATTKDLKDLRVRPPGTKTGENAPPPATTAGKPGAEALGKIGSLVVFPITSEEEGLGKQVAEMIRVKAGRLGATTYDPSSVAEALAGETVTVDTPADKLAALAREKFKADVGVTGNVKGTGPYEVRLVAAYPAPGGRARVVDNTYVCSHHQMLPLEMARATREILHLPASADPNALDPEADKRWRDGPNLVKNPGFEKPSPNGAGPADWQDTGPLATGGQVAWVANPDGPGKVIRFDMDQATAENYGMAYYSDWIPIEAGATYRFSCRYKSLGPTPKIFLKGYHPFEAQGGYAAQRRETYRRQVHPGGPQGEWNPVVADFVPSSLKADQTPTFLKVDLYAYYPAGIIYWDDIVLKKVGDAHPKAAVAPPPSPEAKTRPAPAPPGEGKP